MDSTHEVQEALEEQIAKETAEAARAYAAGATAESVGLNERNGAAAVQENMTVDVDENAADGTGVDGEGLNDEELDRMMGERVSFEPDVEEFLRCLYDEIYGRRVDTIRRLYETEFPQLSAKYFTHCPWPSVDDVSTFYARCDRYHHLIITLYKELYYRHLFLRCPDAVTWVDRRESWKNYSLLLHFLAEVECGERSSGRESLRLPVQWVWDLLDEFVYQFEDACRWKQRMCRKLSEDTEERDHFLKLMEDDNYVWMPAQVMELIHALVVESDIVKQLNAAREDVNILKQGENELRFQLGYFALIMMHRLHVQTGDFYGAIRTVADLELSTKALLWKVPAAHTSLFYYLGFAYLMLRRYSDCIRVMSQLLIHVARQRTYLSSNSYQQAHMTKTVDRMYVLILLASSLCNIRVDDSINQNIKEKYNDLYYKLQQESEEAYCELFTWACPKLINPASPPLSDLAALEHFGNSQSEIQLRICKLFLKEFENRKKINTINSFAKLYNNIQFSKLASLMEISDKDPEDVVRSEILSVKYKGQQKIWRSGPLLSGETGIATSDGTVDFHVDCDVIHVKDQQMQRAYVDHFLKQIERTEVLLATIQGATVPKPMPRDSRTPSGHQSQGVQQNYQQVGWQQQYQHEAPERSQLSRNQVLA